jgi:hypothetical protein
VRAYARQEDYLLGIARSNDDKRDVDAAADELYGLPLADFTRRRDELARGLRKDGRREEADAVKSLRKPTTAAWALNQLARLRRQDVARLLEAGERLRAAQDELLAGGGRSALDAASAEERELVGSLARDAAAIAAEAGTGSSEPFVEKLRSTLHAAAADEEVARQLAAGRLLRESEAVGVFGMPAEGTPAPRPPPAATKTKRPARELRELERRLKAARAEERDARKRKERSERTTERAREQAEQAAKRLDTARRDEEEATAALEAAEEEARLLEAELEALKQDR